MNSVEWHRFSSETKDAAIEWQTRLSSDNATNADYEAFSDWIAASPEHFEAFAVAEEFAADLAVLGDEDQAALEVPQHASALSARPHRPVDRVFTQAEKVVAAIAAALLVTVGISYYFQFNPQIERATITAAANEFESVQLTDGTSVRLSPGTVIETEYRRKERRVTSVNGRAYFDVQSNYERPFTVAFGDKEIMVVGTAFEVASFANSRSVAVTEGLVVVRSVGEGPASNQFNLSSGDRLSISDEHPDGAIEEIATEGIAQWRVGYFEFENAQVSEIVSRLNEFYGRSAFKMSDDVSEIEFSGILKLSDPVGTARTMSELLPLRIDDANGDILLSPEARDL